jgi:hypothetical protein
LKEPLQHRVSHRSNAIFSLRLSQSKSTSVRKTTPEKAAAPAKCLALL